MRPEIRHFPAFLFLAFAPGMLVGDFFNCVLNGSLKKEADITYLELCSVNFTFNVTQVSIENICLISIYFITMNLPKMGL